MDTEIADEFRALGLELPGEPLNQTETFEVMRSNWHSVSAFLSLETQWRMLAGPAGLVWTGLDYRAAAAAFKGRSRHAWAKLLADLKIMEDAALPILNGERP
ncbi:MULTISPECIES: DUF1799 domain-containing protein [unclassified Roseibium]|uniref:DUF1799 domain-containing protein n=1 Tax=unclassified Roseibium TaxID=2629323 RepID=UPI00273FB6CD|nr:MULTISPECIES: DUF1799 domain-containing protein [unclassified Roseibium]